MTICKYVAANPANPWSPDAKKVRHCPASQIMKLVMQKAGLRQPFWFADEFLNGCWREQLLWRGLLNLKLGDVVEALCRSSSSLLSRGRSYAVDTQPTGTTTKLEKRRAAFSLHLA